MRVKSLTSLSLLLSMMPASFAGEKDKISLSLSPYLSGGMMGIKDMSYSPLAYNGPLAGVGFCFMAQSKRVDFLLDITASYGWLGNMYHRDLSLMHNRHMDVSLGCVTGIFDNKIISLKAGGIFGFMRNDQMNRRFKRYHYTLAFDAKTYISAELTLSRGWSVLIEDRIPVIAFLSPSNRLADGRPDRGLVYTCKAFPGNDFKAGVGWILDGRNNVMLYIRHFSYAASNALSDCFQIQFLELGLSFRFDFSKHGQNES